MVDPDSTTGTTSFSQPFSAYGRSKAQVHFSVSLVKREMTALHKEANFWNDWDEETCVSGVDLSFCPVAIQFGRVPDNALVKRRLGRVRARKKLLGAPASLT